MIVFFVFIGKYEVFFSIIDCWKIRGVLSALVVGWKKRKANYQNTSVDVIPPKENVPLAISKIYR